MKCYFIIFLLALFSINTFADSPSNSSGKELYKIENFQESVSKNTGVSSFNVGSAIKNMFFEKIKKISEKCNTEVLITDDENEPTSKVQLTVTGNKEILTCFLSKTKYLKN